MSQTMKRDAREAMPATEPRDAEQAGVVERGPKIIWLEPPEEASPIDGQLWSREPFESDKYNSIKYIRADLVSKAASPPPQPTPEAREAGDGWLGWQPIETAPKDGTLVLVYWPRMAVDEDGELTGETLPGPGHVSVSSNEFGGWEPDNIVDANGTWFGDDFEFGNPTHWMPTPAPPALLTGSKQ